MARDARAGISILELVVVLGIVGVVMAMAVTRMDSWAADQRAATSARDVADAFNLARAEALRTGNSFIVAFREESGLDNVTSDIVIANDGPSTTANCKIAATEIVHTVTLERGVSFGLAASVPTASIVAPDDGGTSGRQRFGSSFLNGTTGNASWVVFQADGMPRRFTQNTNAAVACQVITAVGTGAGAIYVNNGHRNYAAVLTPLGTVRLHRFLGAAAGWTQ